jgi:hypothetical protein
MSIDWVLNWRTLCSLGVSQSQHKASVNVLHGEQVCHWWWYSSEDHGMSPERTSGVRRARRYGHDDKVNRSRPWLTDSVNKICKGVVGAGRGFMSY